MLRAHRREVSSVEREDHLGLQSLGEGDNGRIGSAEGKVRVAFDQLSDSNPVVPVGGFDRVFSTGWRVRSGPRRAPSGSRRLSIVRRVTCRVQR